MLSWIAPLLFIKRLKGDHNQLKPEDQSNINQDILSFLDNLNQVDDRHIALFYEEPELAKTIEYRLISDGLLKGQHCFLSYLKIITIFKQLNMK
jgi:hypothetical protein